VKLSRIYQIGLWGVFLFLSPGLLATQQPGTDISAEKIHELAQSRQWLRLLHYNRTFPFFKLKGRVDGLAFYASPDGDTDPEAEMRADIAAFSDHSRQIGRFKQHPQCAYPARYRFLKKELGLTVTDVACEKYDQFVKKFNAKSVSFVFSSAYPNNPGSMFGHTFIRINSKDSGDQKKLDLLDQAISYAAWVDENENGFSFAILGIFGGYLGQFSMIPYYTKVNEYVHTESRDLWEYNLNINEEEALRLIGSAWEIETTATLDYYFFDENCAYVLLALLEVAKPEWDLVGSPIYLAPAKAVRKIAEVPGAVTGVNFRPSLRKKMLAKVNALSPAKREQVHAILEGREKPEGRTSADDRGVLEAVNSFLIYEKRRDADKFSPERAKLLSDTLVARSKLGVASAEESATEIYSDETRPDLAHEIYRLGLSSGAARVGDANGFQSFHDLNFKFALHDLMNNDLGYTRYQEINFPSITLRYWGSNQSLRLEHLNLVGLYSLFPVNSLESKFSWKGALELTAPKDFGCINCDVARFGGGIGYAIEPFGQWMTSYLLGQTGFEVGNPLREGYRILIGPEAGVIFNPLQAWKARFSAILNFDPIQKNRSPYFLRLGHDQSLGLNPNFELRAAFEKIWLSSTHRAAYEEIKGSLNFYF